ncbi:unnamed protein product [Symbiodinium sp. CCMP2592]|nr:unnamed protein product [Symbiodinium sp. CCMP2592]
MPAWERRQMLVLPCALPSGHSDVPLVVPRQDAKAKLITDSSGQILSYCEDEFLKDSRVQILWLQISPGSADEAGRTIYLYTASKHASVSTTPDRRHLELGAAVPCRCPEQCLILADLFSAKGTATGSWVAFFDVEAAARSVSILPAPNEGDQKPAGRALKLDPCNGRLALRRRFASIQPCAGRQLYIRIFFHDEGEESAHWFGIASKHGTCAVGVSATSRQYMVANGTCPGALSGTQNVTQGSPTCLHRSRGWRVFEVVFEEGMVSIAIDGRGVFAGIAKGARQASDDHLWIIAQSGAASSWAALEVFQIPSACLLPSWRLGRKRCPPESSCGPWEVRSEEVGQWMDDCHGQIWRVPVLDGSPASPCGKSLDMTESAALPGINDLGHVAFNSAAECRSPHARQARSKTPSYLCLPKQISQSELLSNLEFVVKCGGGFLNSRDFQKRHGNIDKFTSPASFSRKKHQSSSQDAILRLVSVRSQGSLRLRELRAFREGRCKLPSSAPASRPSTSQ